MLTLLDIVQLATEETDLFSQRATPDVHGCSIHVLGWHSEATSVYHSMMNLATLLEYSHGKNTKEQLCEYFIQNSPQSSKKVSQQNTMVSHTRV